MDFAVFIQFDNITIWPSYAIFRSKDGKRYSLFFSKKDIPAPGTVSDREKIDAYETISGKTTEDKVADLCRNTNVAYLRPDFCVIGGISAGMKIAHIAEDYGVGIIPQHP